MARFTGAVFRYPILIGLAVALVAAAQVFAQSSSSSVTVDMSVLDELGPPDPGAEGDAIDLRPPSAPKPPIQQASPPPKPEPEAPTPTPAPAATEPVPDQPPKPEAEAVVSEPEIVPPKPTEPEVAEPEAIEPAEPADIEPVAPEAAASAPELEPEAAVEDPAAVPEQPAEDPAPAEDQTAPAAEDTAPPEAPETQSAALTPNNEGAPSLRIEFEDESSELPGSAAPSLAEVVGLLSQDDNRRLVIYAYADGAGKTESQARRLSLSRALAVRRYLVENGIRGTRAEIRALGQKAEDGPIDRVDLVVIER